MNLGCPGETSNGADRRKPSARRQASTNDLAASAYQGLGDWHPCAYKNVDGFPLKTRGKADAISELEDAVSILTETNQKTDVKAITLNIGSKRRARRDRQCKNEPEKEFEKARAGQYGVARLEAGPGVIEYTGEVLFRTFSRT